MLKTQWYVVPTIITKSERTKENLHFILHYNIHTTLSSKKQRIFNNASL